jgi:uncharacterized C2H2 Zn-finger protein
VPRKRRAAKIPSKTATRSRARTFKCPECGKTFTRAASLGAHRRRAHGVPGASAQAKTRASRGRAGKRLTTAASRNGSRVRGRTVPARNRRSAPAKSTTGRSARARSGDGRVNRDALLQALFPAGVPAREAVIRAVHSWLDEAERLAKLT